MGKIDREFLAISGIQSILNFFDGKHKVEFNCTEVLLGDFRYFAVCSPTDRIQIQEEWDEKEFLECWKEYYEKGRPRDPLFSFSCGENTKMIEFFEKRMSSKKIPFLPGLFGLDENATLQQILAKSKELKYLINFACYPHYKKKIFEVSAANPTKFERGPTKEFLPVWVFDEANNGCGEIMAGVHLGVFLDPVKQNVNIIVLMDQDFGNPCFLVGDVNRETDVVQEIMKFVESDARPNTVFCHYYMPEPPLKMISRIEGNIVYGFWDSQGHLSYKPDLAGKEIFKKILEVTPKGTSLHRSATNRKILEILSLADGKPRNAVYKEDVLSLEWSKVQILVYEGCFFVRQLDGTLSKACFEIDSGLREAKEMAKEMVDATLKSSNAYQKDLSSSASKEDQNEEKSSIISSSTNPTEKPCTDEPKVLPISTANTTTEQISGKDEPTVLPKQLKSQGPKSQKPRISGNFNQKTNQKKGLTQKPDIGNQGNQDPSRTKPQGKPKFVLVEVDKIKKGNKKPNETRRKDVGRLVPDKTKIDIIRLSLIATVCCLIGAGIWFVKVPVGKGEFIDVTQRRLSSSHKNKEPRKK